MARLRLLLKAEAVELADELGVTLEKELNQLPQEKQEYTGLRRALKFSLYHLFVISTNMFCRLLDAQLYMRRYGWTVIHTYSRDNTERTGYFVTIFQIKKKS